jgi:hypothetical protein
MRPSCAPTPSSALSRPEKLNDAPVLLLARDEECVHVLDQDQ